MKNLQRVVSVNQDSDKFSDIYRCRRPWLWAAVAAMVLWAAVVPAQAQVIDDPIAYWTFENGASGLVNQAVSGPYHDATVLSGEPAFGLASGEAGLVGNALVLDGASALRLPYHQDSLGQSFTISLWYWQSTNDTRMTVYQTKDTWNISCEATGNNSVFRNYVGESDAGAIQTGLKEWVHLVHAFATEAGNTTLKVYTNGVLASTKSVPSASVFELRQIRALYLGSYRDIGRYFKGMIDEIGLWNRTLSDQEVAALRQRGLAGSPLSVASNAWPRIELGSSQRSVTLNAEAQTPGVYQDGWLREEVLKSPYAFHLPDKAARQDDTAGNSGGPFHAEALGSKYRVPMTSALSQLTAGDFTLETRFRVTEGGRGIFMGNYSNNVINAVNLELAADNRVRLYVQPPSGETKCDLFASAGAVNLRAGAWHHLAGLRRSDVFYLYLDGVKIGQANDVAGAFSLGGPCYYLKNDSRSDATRFLGDMQNTRLWTRALTTNELFSLAAGALPGGGATVSSGGMLAEYAGLYGPYTASYANPKYRIPLAPPLASMTRTNFTVETWFCTTNTGRGILLGSYAYSELKSYLNLELTADSRVRLCFNPATNTLPKVDLYATVSNLCDGTWHHLAGLRRDGTATLYVDGKQVGSKAYTTGPSDLTVPYLYLGRDIRTDTTMFDGDLKNARMWNRALSADEVTSLAAGKVPGGQEVAIEGLLAAYDYYVIPTNSLRTAGYPGMHFWRSYVAGTNKLTFVFKGLPPHREIGIGALVSQLDALKPVASNDHFAIVADGREVLKAWVGSGSTDEPAIVSLHLSGRMDATRLLVDCSTLDNQNLFWCESGTEDYNDHVYDLTRLEALQHMPHTGDALTLVFLGVQNQDGSNAGFGIDQVELKVPSFRGTVVLLGYGCAFLQNGVTAHRGNSGELPENTIPAFESALSLGVDWIETDIYLTQDQQVVICHDTDTARVGDKNLDIATSTYAELLTVDMATDFRRRYNLTIEQCPPLRMPLLADVLRIVMKQNRTRFSLQPKDECVNAAFEVIQQMRAEKWVGFNDGSLTKMRQVKSLNPDVPVFWDRDAQSDIANDILIAQTEGFESLVVNKEGLTEEKVDAIRQAGLMAGVWTVNSEEELKHFLSIGVQRIYTDYPALLLQLAD